MQTLPNAYQEMSLEVHFLLSLLDFFPENLSDVSDEQGEHFHQDIKSKEHGCPGFWKDSMLADIVPWCCRRSALQKDTIIFLTFAFSTSNDTICTKLYFMSWKCAYVSDLLQIFEYQRLRCLVHSTRARENFKKSS